MTDKTRIIWMAEDAGITHKAWGFRIHYPGGQLSQGPVVVQQGE